MRDMKLLEAPAAAPATDERLRQPNEAVRQARVFYDQAVAAQFAASAAWERAKHADPIRGMTDPAGADRARRQVERCEAAVTVADQELKAARVARREVREAIEREAEAATQARIDARSARKEAARQERTVGAAHRLVEASEAPRSALDSVRGRMERLVAGRV